MNKPNENSPKADPILKVRHLRQYFPMKGTRDSVHAVDDLSFDVKRGEILGLVGESGCGKTTTGRAIIKLYEATGGYIEFNGHPIFNGKKGRRKVIRDREFQTQVAKKNLETVRDELILARPMEKAAIEEKFNKQIRQEDLDLEDFTIKYDEFIQSCPPADPTPEQMSRMQMIFQDPISSLNPRMTVREIIAEGLIIQGVTDQKFITDRVNEALERVGLVRSHANRYPHEFSGGQRQRVGIARAVIMKPDMIIADEPVSALDVSVQAQVLNLLNELSEELNLSIIFIAHNLSVVKYFSDRIAVMYFGKIVELCSSDELFHCPLHPYTKSLLSAIPYPDPLYEKTRQRIDYNPKVEHDYLFDKPSLREIVPDHLVYCNGEEAARYQEEARQKSLFYHAVAEEQ